MANRIQFLSIPELKDGTVNTATRLARRVKFRGRKLRPGPMLNAVVLGFLAMDEEAQAAVVEEGLRRFEELLAHDEPRDDLVSPGAGSDDPPARGESRHLPSAVWNMRVPDERKRREPADEVGEGLHGDDEPVGKGRRSPRRK